MQWQSQCGGDSLQRYLLYVRIVIDFRKAVKNDYLLVDQRLLEILATVLAGMIRTRINPVRFIRLIHNPAFCLDGRSRNPHGLVERRSFDPAVHIGAGNILSNGSASPRCRFE